MKKPPCSSFPHNMRRRREGLGWSLMRLSAETGIPEPFLKIYEDGDGSPTMANLALIALALRVTDLLAFISDPEAAFESREPSPAADLLIRYAAAPPHVRTAIDALLDRHDIRPSIYALQKGA